MIRLVLTVIEEGGEEKTIYANYIKEGESLAFLGHIPSFDTKTLICEGFKFKPYMVEKETP